uniref:Uncharacterized protein n=1 Tax=Chromera velia CCMP2878 TaxID=1169474 RepID=A0A0G4G634_9ALVE|eukprot:Cvel_4211.t1-p1 / transcript=Cvel_4211.t1 / gene=Cvel_4211 / organism=Chromera_velia_CCMP2878 / gene_product=hypothetical protein / transcript_product=hypothetical protein / location=Cvel_scaffold182:7656-13766(-) / protein_length=1115 / sequence_SO=supercontig / SO=protein_coding / is_pseudo=false
MTVGDEGEVASGVSPDAAEGNGTNSSNSLQSSNTEETEMVEDALCLFLQRLKLNSQTLSGLARTRSSFGLAWLGTFLFTKNKALGKVKIELPNGIDLSGTRGISREKIYLILDHLPASIEEMTLGPIVLKGDALPFFLCFLDRLEDARQRGQRVLRLTRFAAAENSVGPHEASQILRQLVPFLQSLSLKGNAVGLEGIRTFAEEIRAGRAAFLKSLDLEKTGLVKDRLETFCEALKEKPLAVLETLNLSGNKLKEADMRSLCSILSVACLPSLRELALSNCEFVGGMEKLAENVGEGHLPKLETLDLSGNGWDSRGHLGWTWRGFDPAPVGRSLRREAVPCLKKLNLMTDKPLTDREGVAGFLAALRTPECQPLEHVGLNLESVRDEDLRGLGAGLYPAIRILLLELDPRSLAMFLRGVVHTPEEGETETQTEWYELKLDTLDLIVEFGYGGVYGGEPLIDEWLWLFAEALEKGRLSSLRQIKMWGNRRVLLGHHHHHHHHVLEDNLKEGKAGFFSSLSLTQLPRLTKLSLTYMRLSDFDMSLLGEAVRVGSLPSLKYLELRENIGLGVGGEEGAEGIGRVGINALMKGVVESEDGLPMLERLDLCRTRAGEGGASLWTALLSGKLPRLSRIDLSYAGMNAEAVTGLADAVRSGGLVEVSILDLRENGGVGNGVWDTFMHAIAESEAGLPRLRTLGLPYVLAIEGGGAIATALGSGKLPALEELETLPLAFRLDEQGLQCLADAVRTGRFPPRLRGVSFNLCEHLPRINLDPLLVAIAESEKGLPPCVRALNLRGGHLGEGSLAALQGSTFAGKLSDLQCLDFHDCLSNAGLTDETIRSLAAAVRVGALAGLSSLDLSENGDVGAAAWRDFMQAIAESKGGLPRLRTLMLENTHAEEEGGALVTALGSGNLPNLESLLPYSLRVAREGARAFAEALRTGKFPCHLQNLSVSVCGELDPLVFAIAESDVGLPSCISSLKLRGGRLGVEALAALAASRKAGRPEVHVTCVGEKLTALKDLDLSSCEIDDQSLQRLGEVFAVHTCPDLRSLCLDGNKFTAEGFSAFVDALKYESLSRIHHLSLSQENSDASFTAAVKKILQRARNERKLLRGLKSAIF